MQRPENNTQPGLTTFQRSPDAYDTAKGQKGADDMRYYHLNLEKERRDMKKLDRIAVELKEFYRSSYKERKLSTSEPSSC